MKKIKKKERGGGRRSDEFYVQKEVDGEKDKGDASMRRRRDAGQALKKLLGIRMSECNNA